LGRPRKLTKPELIGPMRSQGASWRVIGKALGVSPATAWCAADSLLRVAKKTSAGAVVTESF